MTNKINIFGTIGLFVLISIFTGCKTTSDWKNDADKVANKNLEAAQKLVTGDVEKIDIETPSVTLRRKLIEAQGLVIGDDFSMGKPNNIDVEYDKAAYTNDIYLTFEDVLKIAAANSRDFQAQKESLFKVALALDLEDDAFRTTFSGLMSSAFSSSRGDDERRSGLDNGLDLKAKQKFKNGTELTGSIAVDLAKMLSPDKDSAWGLVTDVSVTIPLLRGSGRFVVEEPLIQAQRNLVYAVRAFEQYKRTFMVRIASSYYNVLLAKRQLLNQEENYKRAIASTRRSRRMADAGRLQEYEFDQSYQNELGARNSWVSSNSNYESKLEQFRILIGLPPDSRIFPKEEELLKLKAYAESFAAKNDIKYEADEAMNWDEIELKKPDGSNKGPRETSEKRAIDLALAYRTDLQTARDELDDAERKIRIAADRLRAEITIGGSASAGEARSYGGASAGNGDYDLSRASYRALLNIDLPFNRTSERNSYRNALIAYEAAIRNYQEKEDSLKQTISNQVRNISENREVLTIQFMAVSLAERRVQSMDILLQAGRADMTDVLSAQNSLLSAQNSLYSAIIGYRINELSLQSELGILDVTAAGEWTEFSPDDYPL